MTAIISPSFILDIDVLNALNYVLIVLIILIYFYLLNKGTSKDDRKFTLSIKVPPFIEILDKNGDRIRIVLQQEPSATLTAPFTTFFNNIKTNAIAAGK